jgi:gamma-glutamyltranspeptidase/glutathione hydrolase
MQRELATTLARIRSHGVGGFYVGATGRLLVSESAEKGGGLTQADLSNYRPLVASAKAVSAGELNVMFPVTKTGAGSFATALWPHIQGVSGASALERVAEKTAGGAPDTDYGSTAFVTVDGKGGAVACGVSMNGAFGTRREARGSGVIFAPASGASGGTFLTPIIVARAKSVEGLYGVIAGAGAPKGGAAAESVVAAALTGVGGAVEKALAASPADARSPVNAIICLEGLPRGSCSLYANPKGAGVGFSAAAAGSF